MRSESGGMGDPVPLLAQANDHSLANEVRRQAESLLLSFARTQEGLLWALSIIKTDAGDPNVHFFAASVLDHAVKPYNWPRQPPSQQATLRTCLWEASLDPKPGVPHYVTSKVIAALATLACSEDNSCRMFLADLHVRMEEGRDIRSALKVLDAILEHLGHLSRSCSIGQQGLILNSDYDLLQFRLKLAQTAALQMLLPLLKQLLLSTGDEDPLRTALLLEALTPLRNILAHQSSSFTALDNEHIGREVMGVALSCMGRLYLDPGTPADEAVACSAMACIEEILPRPRSSTATVAIIKEVLHALRALFQNLATREAAAERSGRCCKYRQVESKLTGIQLFCQVVQHHLAPVVGNTESMRDIDLILKAMKILVETTGCPGDLLILFEMWHPIISYLHEIEKDEESLHHYTDGGQDVCLSAESNFRSGIVDMATMLVNTLFSDQNDGNAYHRIPFRVCQLSDEPGSGSELSDLLTKISAGHDSDPALGVDEILQEDWEEVFDCPQSREQGGTRSGWASEREIYAQHAACFFSAAVATYAPSLVPIGLQPLPCALSEARKAGALLAKRNILSELEESLARLSCYRLKVALALTRFCLPFKQFAYGDWATAFAAAGAPTPETNTEAPLPPEGSLAKVLLLQDLYRFGHDWILTVQHILQLPPAVGERIPLNAFLGLSEEIFSCITAASTYGMPEVLEGFPHIAGQLVVATMDLVSKALVLSSSIQSSIMLIQMQPECAEAARKVAAAAAFCLSSLTSATLSSIMHTPVELLQAACRSTSLSSLHGIAVTGLTGHEGTVLATGPLSTLWTCISNLGLRSWTSALQANNCHIEERTAAFGALMQPLIHFLSFQPSHGVHGALCKASSAGAAVIDSFTGSPKAVRKIAFMSFVSPVLVSTTDTLRTANGGGTSLLATKALLRVLAAALRTFSAELGTEGVRELLSSLMNALAKVSGGDPRFSAELSFFSLVVSALSFGAGKHSALVSPALEFGLNTLEKVGPEGSCHVRAKILCNLVDILRNNWRSIAPPATGHPNPSNDATPRHAIYVFSQVTAFFVDAANERIVPSNEDVKSVLDEVYQIQVVSKGYWRPDVAPLRDSLIDSLLILLMSRMFTAQSQLIDAIYILASSNWSSFLLEIFPGFVETRLRDLGARGPELVATHFGFRDPRGAGDFERAMLAFVNDATFWRRSM